MAVMVMCASIMELPAQPVGVRPHAVDVRSQADSSPGTGVSVGGNQPQDARTQRRKETRQGALSSAPVARSAGRAARWRDSRALRIRSPPLATASSSLGVLALKWAPVTMVGELDGQELRNATGPIFARGRRDTALAEVCGVSLQDSAPRLSFHLKYHLNGCLKLAGQAGSADLAGFAVRCRRAIETIPAWPGAAGVESNRRCVPPGLHWAGGVFFAHIGPCLESGLTLRLLPSTHWRVRLTKTVMVRCRKRPRAI
jgi:hypothetical protein